MSIRAVQLRRAPPVLQLNFLCVVEGRSGAELGFGDRGGVVCCCGGGVGFARCGPLAEPEEEEPEAGDEEDAEGRAGADCGFGSGGEAAAGRGRG